MTQVAPQPARRDRRDPGYGSHALPPRREEPFPQQRTAGAAGRLRGRHATTGEQGFGSLVAWTVAGSILPGLGLLAAGRRVAGRLLLTVTLLVAAALAAFAVLGDPLEFALRTATSTDKLLAVAVGACVLALFWGLVVVATHASLRRFATLTGFQAAMSSLLVTTIVGGGVVAAYATAQASLITRDTLQSLTKNAPARVQGTAAPRNDQADPWAGTPRVNVLLIGSDAGADRDGVRTDSMILASIDTHTGDAVLLGLPRNMQRIPFPEGSPGAREYPDGFQCVDNAGVPQCLFNALWKYGTDHAADPYYRKSPWKNPGLQATIDGVKAVTGLGVDDYVILDMAGFAKFINAIGGVVLTFHTPISVAGHEVNGREVGVKYRLQPGTRRFMGYEAMWFARSRSNSNDFERMGRQRCVIAAVTSQTNPVTLARAFPDIAAAIKDDLRMSIPIEDLSAWVTLLLRVKSGHIRSLPFTQSNVSTSHPDFEKIHRMVQDAIAGQSTTVPKKKPTTKPSGSTPTAGTPAPADTTKAVDVKDVC